MTNGVNGHTDGSNGSMATGIVATSSYATRVGDSTKLATWKSRPVEYEKQEADYIPYYQNTQTGKKERIWLPNGPADRPNPYTEAPPEVYQSELGALLKQVYDYVREKGDFEDLVPEIPPKREWISWDL
jgi:nucleoporin NUP42